jgi:serine/threonine protein kinase
MSTPHDPLPSAAPSDPVAAPPTADLNATAGGAAPPATVPTGPPMSADRYVLGDEIARGGMGVVYRAADTTLGRQVAVKVLQDKFQPGSGVARRFADEARIMGQLQHPAVPPVHDLGSLPDGRPFLAMKLIKGNTLDALLKARTNPGDERGRFVAVFEQVCQALACAHDHGVIHRDLKPANVMVGSYGEVQVMDWGLTKVLGARTAADDHGETLAGTVIHGLRDSGGEFTQAGSILGTPAFMPPEQAIGAVDQVDARSDVFGLGGILCMILAGRPPFEGDSAEGIRQSSARGKVAEAFARLDSCGADPEMIALCKRCLAPEREDRPADAGEVARTVAGLRMAADERARQAELERAAATARSAERRKRRQLVVAAAVVLAVAVVGGLSAVLLVQRRSNADLADKNKELADKNTELAEEKVKVEQRFELAQKAIAKLHTGVSEDMLLKSDQFKELRTQLLKEAADFYADLEKLLQGQTDAKSRRLLAAGYFQLAQLTGQIGSRTEALAMHRKALAVRRELAAAAGADVETRLDVAHSLGAMGTLLLSSDTEAALRAFVEQHDVAAALEAESPTEAVQAVLAQSFNNTGRALWWMGRSAEVPAACEKAVAILRKLAEANPADTELRYDLALSQITTSGSLAEMGKWAESFAAQEDARAILERLAEANPAVTQFRLKLGTVHTNIGSTLLDAGKPAEALASHQKSLAISMKLADTHPAVAEFQRSLVFNHNNIGDTLSEMGKLTESMAAYEKGLEVARKLAEANPTDLQLKWLVAWSHNGIGDVYKQMGKPGEALKFHENARTLLMEAAESKSALALLHNELARSLTFIGLLQSASGKPAEALESCKNAVAIRQKLSDAHPANIWWREGLADSLSELGAVQHRAGRPAESVASLRRAIALVEHLPTLMPRDYYNLACYHSQLAAVATEAGSGLTAEQGAAEAEQAMAALRQAAAAGFGCVGRLRADASLDALRPREDFRTLVKELEEKEEKAAKAREVAPLPGPK